MDGWLRQGVLVKSAYRGVSHLAGTPDTDVRQAWSARLRVQDGRLGPGGSLALARVEGFLLPRDLDATVRFPHVVNQPGLRTWSLVWESCDEQLRSGVPGLTVVRSLVAVAPTVSEKVLRVGFDSARRRGHTALDAARRRVEELVALGVDGAEVMLHMLSSPAAAAESEGERVLAAFLEPLGIDLEFGVSDVVPGRRLDAFERHILLAYEYDGRDHHVLPTDRDHDGLRSLEVKVTGVEIIVVTAGMIRERPKETLAMIERIRLQRLLELAPVAPPGLPPPVTGQTG